MSITRGIEVVYKDGTKIENDNRYIAWKNPMMDLWICDFLFDKCNLTFEKVWGNEYVCKIPNEFAWELADRLIKQEFEIFEGYHTTFGTDEKDKEDAQRYGQAIKELIEKVKDYEIISYYDYGN